MGLLSSLHSFTQLLTLLSLLLFGFTRRERVGGCEGFVVDGLVSRRLVMACVERKMLS
jgi:hypothetical protein